MTELTVRELVAELAMGPVDDFDLPARVVMARRGLLAKPTDPVNGTPLKHSAGAWVTLTVRLQAPDRDLVIPGHIAIVEAIAGLFGRPLLVDDVNLQHHQRFSWAGDQP